MNGLAGRYTLLDVVEAHGHRFVELRNPWANSTEWRGEWSDTSTAWAKNPKVARALEWKPDLNDGVFWMAFDDFCAHYAHVTWYSTKRAEEHAKRTFARRRKHRKRS